MSITNNKNSKKKIVYKCAFNTNGAEVLSVRFDPEDSVVAAGCSDGHLRVFNLHTGFLKFDDKICE